MQGRRYVVVEYFGGRGFDLIPYNPSIGDFQPPQSRVIGRYSSHAPARAALDRACPASRRIAMPGF